MGSGPLSNFPTIGHAIIAITFLILIICFAVQPILSAFGTLIAIWFFIGICCGLLDTTINTILLRMWGHRVDNKMQAIHLVSGVGSALSPVIILVSIKWTGCYHFGVWFISAISLIAGLLPLFVRMPILDLDIWEPRRVKRVRGEHVIIGLLAGLLFVTNGLDVTVSNWLLTWNAVRMEQQLPHNTTAPLIPILSGNDTATPVISPATAIDLPKCVLPVWPPPHTFDPTALPDGPFLLLSLYWASYTMARLLGLPLITRAGPRVLTLLVIVGVSIAVAVYQLYTTSVLVTWVCTGLIGFFIANLFPNVIALPANFDISITSPDSMKLLIGAGIGEIVWPIVSGEVWLYFGPEYTHYGLLGSFTLAAILFLVIMIVLTCSKSLRARDSVPSSPRTPQIVTRSNERTPLLTHYQDM
jgi:fucose permease